MLFVNCSRKDSKFKTFSRYCTLVILLYGLVASFSLSKDSIIWAQKFNETSESESKGSIPLDSNMNLTQRLKNASEMAKSLSPSALTGGPKPYFSMAKVGNTTKLMPKEDFYILEPTNKYILRLDKVSIGT